MKMPQNRAPTQGNRADFAGASIWGDLLARGLEDDGWPWDWTTLGCLSLQGRKRGRARIIAKSSGIWAADGLALALRSRFPALAALAKVRNGDRVDPGETVMEWRGDARWILALERPFLNLASYVGGIATRTATLVESVARACPRNTPRVTATRKTLPGYRDLAIQGILAGGGYPHRVSLSGGILIKENHIAAARGVRPAIEGTRGVAPHGLRIEIEVRSLRELEEALEAGVDGVLLDNFSVPAVRRALGRINDFREARGWRPVVEVSGGLTEENIASYAMEGVNVLSVGSLTHSVRSLDLSLLFSGVSGVSGVGRR